MLKLPRLPDRTPVKLTITVTPDMNQLLIDYAEAYRETYGRSEVVADLVPYMLRSFLESDRAFSRTRTKP